MNAEMLCMGCMRDKGDASVCSECGWQEGTPPESPAQLSPRTILQEKYQLGRVLGQGGFGITYLAWDLLLNRKLAIKEYFPREICGRARDERTVQALSQRSRQDFTYGLSKFVEEGQNLARFRDYPGIVSLLDFFEANGTAYIVMAYMEGMTLKQYLERQGGKIGFDAALAILTPVMDALREVHAAGMLHRDISPDNIYLNQDRQVKILDFGATRYAMRDQSHGLTVLFKPGYAPFEQYSSGGKQGPWTDVYALAATFYRALTGKAPSEAPDRLAKDDLMPPSAMGISIPPESELALLKALAVQWGKRFQNIRDFQEAIVPAPATDNADKRSPPAPRPGRLQPIFIAAACILLLTTLLFAGLWRSTTQQLQAANAKLSSSVPGPDHSDNSAELATLRNELNKTETALDSANAQISTLNEQLAESQRRLSGANTNRPDLQTKIQELTQSLTAAQQARDNAAREADTARAEAASLRQQLEASHLRIVNFELLPWNGAGKVQSNPAVRFQSSSTRYIICALGGPNLNHGSRALSGAVEVRYIGPSGAIKYKTTVPVTASSSEPSWVTQAVWGNDNPGSYERGTWRIEAWSEGQRILSKEFTVY